MKKRRVFERIILSFILAFTIYFGMLFVFVGNAYAAIEITEDNVTITGLDNQLYSIGGGTASYWNGECTYNAGTADESDDDVLINGEEFNTSIVVKDPDGNVTQYSDQETGVAADVADGRVFTATVTFTFSGNYSGTVVKTYKICPSLEYATVQNTDGATGDGYSYSYNYTGSAIKPEFSVTMPYGSETVNLTEGVDYELSDITDSDGNTVSESIDGGNYSFYINGIGNYDGGYYYSYEIIGPDISTLHYTIGETVYYDSTVSVEDGAYSYYVSIVDTANNYTLEEYTDYSVSIEEGTSSAFVITVTGMNKYSGTIKANASHATALISDCSVQELSAMDYTGSAITQNIVVYQSTGETTAELKEGTDYTVEYSNNVNAGVASVTIIGIGDYAGTIGNEFEINALDASSYSVLSTDLDYIIYGESSEYASYDSATNAHTLIFNISAGTNTLVENTDYTVAYTNNTACGTMTYTITYQGNYSGTKSGSLYLVEKYLNIYDTYGINFNDTFEGELDESGNASIDSYFTDLLADYGDYITITGTTATESGEQTATVSFSDAIYAVLYIEGNTYRHTTNDVTFTWNSVSKIITADDELLEVSGLENTGYYYGMTSEYSQFVGTITYDGNELTKDTDYTITQTWVDSNGNDVEYDSETAKLTLSSDAYIYTSTVTIKFIGDYGGTVEKTYKLCPTIEDLDFTCLDEVSVTEDGYPIYPYTGSTIVPNITLKFVGYNNEEFTLTYGTDFTYDFTEINPSESLYEAILSGIGDYAGGNYFYYQITACELSDDFTYTYDDSAIYNPMLEIPATLDLTIVDTNNNTLELDTDYTITYSYDEENMQGTALITGTGNYSGEKEITFNLKYEILDTDLTIEVEDQEYTGEALTPTLTVTSSTYGELTLDTDYEVEYSNNTEIGEATASIILIGKYSGSADVTFRIYSSKISDEAFNISISKSVYYDSSAEQYLYTVEIIDSSNDYTLVEDTDYTVTINSIADSSTVNLVIAGIGDYGGSYTKDVYLASTLIADDWNINFEYDDNTNKYMYFDGVDSYDPASDSNQAPAAPTITITSNTSESLVENTDYFISYSYENEVVNSFFNKEITITIEGSGNYYGKITETYKITATVVTLEITINGPTTLLAALAETDYADAFESIADNIDLTGEGEYETSAKANKGYAFYDGEKYYVEGTITVTVILEREEVIKEVIVATATDAINEVVETKETENPILDIASLSFDVLSGFTKEELIKAKEFYNDLEAYVVNNNLVEIVNQNIKEKGYTVTLTLEEVVQRLKDYLDSCAISNEYSGFTAQVDDAINAITVEEVKVETKIEVTKYIRRHTNASAKEALEKLVSEQFDSVKYDKYTDDETRSDYFGEVEGKIHEIKNVSIQIVKHTQNQTIANNSIEDYYNELKESGKYNEAQLALLKETFDEMQAKVIAVLASESEEGQAAVQEELNKIVLEAIEKLSGVKITNAFASGNSDAAAIISSDVGMDSNTEVLIKEAAKNVSIAVSKAISNKKVTGSENALVLVKNKDIKEAYDIDLTANGENVTVFNGTYTVKILLTDELKTYNNLQIIYITSDGTIEVHDTYIDGDYLVFTTTHFSTYYLMGDKLIDFAPFIKILLGVIVALIIFIVYIVLDLKEKKINQIGFVLSFFAIPLSAFISINVLAVCIALSIVAFILLVVAIILAVKDFKKDRSIDIDEE